MAKKRVKKSNAPVSLQETEDTREARAKIQMLSEKAFDPNSYKVNDRWQNAKRPIQAHSTPELIRFLKENDSIDIEARVIATNGNKAGYQKLNKKQFLEAQSVRKNSRKLRESIDYFGNDGAVGNNNVGNDFTPLLGGPFNKQLYYTDYLRMHATSFHAYNHDPFGRAVVHITRDFTIGKGWRVDFEDERSQDMWDKWVDYVNFDSLVDDIARELSIYGEVMVWELPDEQRYIVQDPVQTDTNPKTFWPRFRMIDPSVIWEIVTHPEDITRKLYYQWVAPTQYQIYTDGKQPTLKFIYQQIPASEVLHYKVNSVSNEKRGRSDFFPALGYMKRLRDTVNYSIIGLQKAAAWSIDTTIEGDQTDIDAYLQDQQSLGTIAPAGSEFIHTDKITRQYLSNEAAGKGGNSTAFDWCLTQIAVSTGIPVSYFGTHLSGEVTRASAFVSTEPVAKKFEKRQQQYAKIITDIARRVMRKFGLPAECEVTFPELITEDRSAKMTDLALAESNGWISKKRAAEIAAKELGIDKFNYEEEKSEIDKNKPDLTMPGAGPLTRPGLEKPKPSGVTSEDKAKVRKSKGF